MRIKLTALIIVLIFTGCSGGGSTPESKMNVFFENKSKWQSKGLVTYEFEYYQDGYAVSDDVRISIVNNMLDFAYNIKSGQALAESDSFLLQFYWSIDDIFEQIERYVPNESFEIEYHPELGYPTRFGRGGVDSFWGVIVIL